MVRPSYPDGGVGLEHEDRHDVMSRMRLWLLFGRFANIWEERLIEGTTRAHNALRPFRATLPRPPRGSSVETSTDSGAGSVDVTHGVVAFVDGQCTDSPEYSVSDGRAAIEKACDLLAAFSDAGNEPLGVTELARRAGLAKSTAYRQLEVLQRTNMIERSGRGYRVGHGLRALARAVLDDERALLGDELLPYLVELFEVTRHTVQLAVLDAAEVAYVGKVSGHRSVVSPTSVGARLPAHCTAGGKLLLAHHARVASVVLASSLEARTPNTIRSRAELAREFTEIRRHGLAVDRGGADLGVWCVATPVVSPGGKPIAAMSVSMPAGSNVAAVGNVLARIAQAASRRLRGTAWQRC